MIIPADKFYAYIIELRTQILSFLYKKTKM